MGWLSESKLRQMVGGSPEVSNLSSVRVSLNEFGESFGLNLPHRLVCYIAQVGHESMSFRYDREVWGPTTAQKRYDIRTDLGNTAAVDGDGYKYRGRTAIQITGMYNYGRFRKWCHTNFPTRFVPDFVTYPDEVLKDPWEGLGPIWYWVVNDLNNYADAGNMEMITKRINGGLNGYGDRLERYTIAGLALLGYAAVEDLQRAHKLVVDGISGPATRKVIHKELLKLAPMEDSKPVVKINIFAYILRMLFGVKS